MLWKMWYLCKTSQCLSNKSRAIHKHPVIWASAFRRTWPITGSLSVFFVSDDNKILMQYWMHCVGLQHLEGNTKKNIAQTLTKTLRNVIYKVPVRGKEGRLQRNLRRWTVCDACSPLYEISYKNVWYLNNGHGNKLGMQAIFTKDKRVKISSQTPTMSKKWPAKCLLHSVASFLSAW